VNIQKSQFSTQEFTMPPRKSDSSKVVTGDEGSVQGTGAGASTAAKKDDGINIEVTASI
jgi:hypothetical protein